MRQSTHLLAVLGLLVLLSTSSHAGPLPTQTIAIELTVTWPERPREHVDLLAEALLEGCARLIHQRYGAWLQVRNAKSDYSVETHIRRREESFLITSSVRALGASQTRTRSSVVVAPGSHAGLLPAVVADIFYLWASYHGFGFPSEDPPRLISILETDTLYHMTGWEHEDMQPTAITASPAGLTVGFTRGFITLGHEFQLVPATMRDMLLVQAHNLDMIPVAVSVSPAQELNLLASDGGRILRLNFFSGTEERLQTGFTALHLKGLPNGGFVLADQTTIAHYVRTDGRTQQHSILAIPGFITAIDADEEANIWIYDAAGRRIRVIHPDGTEIFSVTPCVSPSDLPFVQAFALCSDGSFFLGGAGVLIRFNRYGIPAWMMSTLPGRHREAFPSSYRLAVDEETQSFYVLHLLSRRVLRFSYTEGSQSGIVSGDATLGAPYPVSDIDVTDPSSVMSMVRFLEEQDRVLLALQYVSYAELDGRTSLRLRRQLEKKKIESMLTLARGLDSRLSYTLARTAYSTAYALGETLRAEDLLDAELPKTLDAIALRRKRITDLLSRQETEVMVSVDMRQVAAALLQDCSSNECIRVDLSNKLRIPLKDARLTVSLSLPQAEPSESMLTLIAYQRKSLEIPYALPSNLITLDEDVQISLSALLEYEVPNETKTVYLDQPLLLQGSRTLTTARQGSDAQLVSLLPQYYTPRDPPLEAFLGTHVSGQPSVVHQIALVWLRLERAKLLAGGTFTAYQPSDPLQFPPSTLQSLNGTSLDKALLLCSLLGTIGLQSGLLFANHRIYVVVDTLLPLEAASRGSRYYFAFRSIHYKMLRSSSRASIILPISTDPFTLSHPNDIQTQFSEWLVASMNTLRQEGLQSFTPVWFAPETGPTGSLSVLPSEHLGLLPDEEAIAADVTRALSSLSIQKAQ